MVVKIAFLWTAIAACIIIIFLLLQISEAVTSSRSSILKPSLHRHGHPCGINSGDRQVAGITGELLLLLIVHEVLICRRDNIVLVSASLTVVVNWHCVPSGSCCPRICHLQTLGSVRYMSLRMKFPLKQASSVISIYRKCAQSLWLLSLFGKDRIYRSLILDFPVSIIIPYFACGYSEN